MELYPDRAARDEILDVWMSNLPQSVRDGMIFFGMSEAQYRQRLERHLFGPMLLMSTTTTSNESAATWHIAS